MTRMNWFRASCGALAALAPSLFFPAAAQAVAPAEVPALSGGDTAWMLTSTVLVLAMILPGLALFYGGLVRAKNLLSVLTQVLGVACVALLVWFVWGYSLAFSDGNAFVGGGGKLFLSGIDGDTVFETIPELLFISFQSTFAAITAALVVGALVERVKFTAIILFTPLWLTLVYAPIAHQVWGGGIIAEWGAIDFAGGTVVHINAGVAGVVGVLFAGKRIGFLKEMIPPHSLGLTLIGASLLWVGWFGFNGGSALAADGAAAFAMINTLACPAAAVLTWLLAERIVSGKPSLLGGASGAIAGLVGITPAAGSVGVMGAILLGFVSALGAYWFVASLKNKLKLDDSLDVFGIHGVAGIIGSVGTGILAAPFFGGLGGDDYALGAQTWIQIKAVLFAIAWSAIGSAIVWGIVKYTVGLRVTEDGEREGLDITDHGERSYNL